MGGFNNDPVITIGCGGRNKLPAAALLLALLLALDKGAVNVVPIRGVVEDHQRISMGW